MLNRTKMTAVLAIAGWILAIAPTAQATITAPGGTNSLATRAKPVEGSGNDHAVVSMIPEPATMGVLVIGGVILLTRRKRRK